MVSLFLCTDMSSFWRAFTKLPILLAHLVALQRTFYMKWKNKKEITFDTKLSLSPTVGTCLVPIMSIYNRCQEWEADKGWSYLSEKASTFCWTTIQVSRSGGLDPPSSADKYLGSMWWSNSVESLSWKISKSWRYSSTSLPNLDSSGMKWSWLEQPSSIWSEEVLPALI